MSSRDDPFANDCLHSDYTFFHHTSTQGFQDGIPSDSSRSVALSYHTGDLSRDRPAFETSNVDSDLLDLYTHHSDPNSAGFSPSMDLVLSGIERQTWDVQQYLSNSAPIYDSTQGSWIPELHTGDATKFVWALEDGGGCQTASTSSHMPTRHEFIAGVSFPTSHCDTTSYSEFSANAMLPVFPTQDACNGTRSRHDSAEPLGTQLLPMDSSFMTIEDQRGNMGLAESAPFADVYYAEEVYSVPGNYDALSISEFGTSGSITRESQGMAGLTRDVQKSKLQCTEPGCNVEFSLKADLNRHRRTKHQDEGKGYRCAGEGCPKFGKVWNRLDSFKKHVTLRHKTEDVEDLVRRSTKGSGLPISVTTPRMMLQKSTFDGYGGSMSSRS